MAFELVALSNLVVAPSPFSVSVPRLTWDSYVASDKAGHHVVGHRVYRNTVPSPIGTLVADETSIGPNTTMWDDLTSVFAGVTLYYTVVAVEATDFGARPYGEGGNVTDYGV